MIRAELDPTLTARITASWPLDGVRSGSALVRLGDRLLLVQDDVPAVVLITPPTGAASTSFESRALSNEGRPMSKADKLDLEAALLHPSGDVYVLGSGSAPNRRRIARLSNDATRIAIVDAPALYDALATALGGVPNVEGAVLEADNLLLFHRGAGVHPSATIRCARSALDGGPPGPCSVVQWDLGRVGNVSLTFTDAAPLGPASIAYLAAAEDTANAIDDGPVVGAALGVMSPSGHTRYALLLEPDERASVRKVEGIAPDPSGANAWLVTDPDDPSRPAELCRVELRGPWI